MVVSPMQKSAPRCVFTPPVADFMAFSASIPALATASWDGREVSVPRRENSVKYGFNASMLRDIMEKSISVCDPLSLRSTSPGFGVASSSFFNDRHAVWASRYGTDVSGRSFNASDAFPVSVSVLAFDALITMSFKDWRSISTTSMPLEGNMRFMTALYSQVKASKGSVPTNLTDAFSAGAMWFENMSRSSSMCVFAASFRSLRKYVGNVACEMLYWLPGQTAVFSMSFVAAFIMAVRSAYEYSESPSMTGIMKRKSTCLAAASIRNR